MLKYFTCAISIFILIIHEGIINAQNKTVQESDLEQIFRNPPESAKPWVFWYWMKGAVTKEGITTDLEAMKEAGIAGAYLVPIQESTNPPLISPPVNTLTPEWWEMVKFAFQEARRLGLTFAMHSGDGFATAGGPWITPELSMQKVVWSEFQVDGNTVFNDSLPIPASNENYYRDIAVFAFPSPEGTGISTQTIAPKITTCTGANAGFLIKENNKESFRSDDSCWIQYEFGKPFTCRSVFTKGATYNYQSHRPRIYTSDDGVNFNFLCQLEPSRNGWLDWDEDYTHSIPTVTAKYFRLYFNKKSSEPGAEDNEMAKWKPNLKLQRLQLSSTPVIHQFEGKNGSVWRVAKRTSASVLTDSLCVNIDKIINVTDWLQDGKLNWKVPSGKWTILRMGYTTTGHKNMTAGSGIGLECDKLNPEAVKIQYKNWYGEIRRNLRDDLTSKVLANIHVDSWECGSQNWSPVFMEEFKKRRGYDLIPYLPVMAGIPVQSADVSERFLFDIRETIAELVADNFYGTLSQLAQKDGYSFSGESVAPVMTGDGMLHYKYMDIPMGEFWVNSPTHDKPTDMLEAISAAHIYGKNIVQAEAFTTLRMDWTENPAMLKPIGDRNFALGVNRFVFHVFCQNPWPNRKPGMTLGPTGIFFQPTQTWWKPAKAWIEYTSRCQSLLQFGNPVADIAVFTGEEVPRRALLPERLISTLPGLFNSNVVERENIRLQNINVPVRAMPDGVINSTNTSNPADWVAPLQGYAFDSFNADALLNLAKVENGRIVLPGGANYGVLVIPGLNPMNPNNKIMSVKVAKKLLELANNGAIIILNNRPSQTPGLSQYQLADDTLHMFLNELWNHTNCIKGDSLKGIYSRQVGKGKIIKGPYELPTFNSVGIERDIEISENDKMVQGTIAWNHRKSDNLDIYFISNQQNKERIIDLSFRVTGHRPEIWDPVSGIIHFPGTWQIVKNRTELSVKLAGYQSVYIVFLQETNEMEQRKHPNWKQDNVIGIVKGPWQVTFQPEYGGTGKSVVFDSLSGWSENADKSIKYYSGTATYTKEIEWTHNIAQETILIDLGKVANIAAIKVNGIACGIAWTAPFRVNISRALKKGTNKLEIEVTNTWLNRLIGDSMIPENERIARLVSPPYKIENKHLQEAGLFGPVRILSN